MQPSEKQTICEDLGSSPTTVAWTTKETTKEKGCILTPRRTESISLNNKEHLTPQHLA